jgi:hypothetical protein
MAFNIEFANCWYLGVAENSSKKTSLKKGKCFIAKFKRIHRENR